jgi:hypothetical protein
MLPLEPGSAKLAPWLTILPPRGRTIRIRDLELDW